MENMTKIKVELEIQAQRLIAQYMLNNEVIEKELEVGIKNAFESINIAEVVELNVKKAIESAIRESSEWGKIREAVKKKGDEIVDAHIEKAMKKFKI